MAAPSENGHDESLGEQEMEKWKRERRKKEAQKEVLLGREA